MEKIYMFLANIMYSFVKISSSLAVNSTCCGRFYQEKLDKQLDSLRKYHDEKEEKFEN